MILKRLVAHGFKSFADRTEFDFGPGVTGIVGPNGCGKSNVVDAIRWVLGEQSAKSLRGKQMLDVIFNGSGTRKSGGMAQVDLVFDNTDGTLPIAHAEVTVSRRLYRSGESEYLLNKAACRLKDVRELFLDTGVGVDAYSVIAQGRVDALLQANPQERREIFEEAAGISRFKARKLEAQRKLERVDQNLLRLQDIIDELEKRLRSVKLAAGKARNYQQYSARLKELRSRYVLANYHDLRQRQDQLDMQTTSLSDEATGLRERLCESEARVSELRADIQAMEQEIAQADQQLLGTQSQIAGSQERIAASRQRISDQSHAMQRAEKRMADMMARAATLREQFDGLNERRAAAESEAQSLQARAAELAGEQRGVQGRMHESQRLMEDEKSGVIDVLRRTSSLHNELQNLSIQHKSLSGQKDRLAARDAEIAALIADLLTRREQLENRRNEILSLIDEQNRALEDTRTRAAAAAERRARLGEQLSAAKEYRSGLLARQQTLAELDRSREGLRAGPREVLARRDADDSRRAFSYVLGPIGELFEADVAHAGMIEAVLGELEQYLVVSSRDELLADRDTLYRIEGRIFSYCLDQVQPPINLPDMTGQPGYVACALDWVRVPAECEKLARVLLGRTFVVETVEDARRFSELLGGAKFVTLDGVVWESDGRVAVGALGAGSGLITRRSELRELSGQIDEVSARISALAADATQTDEEIAHLAKVQQELRTAIYEAHTERVETETRLTGVSGESQRLAREQPIVAEEVAAVARQMADAVLREQQSRGELETLEETSRLRHERIAEIERQMAEMSEALRGLQEGVTQARVAAGEAAQRHAALVEQIRAARDAVEQSETEAARAQRESADVAARVDEARRVVEETELALLELLQTSDGLTHRLGELRGSRERLQFESQERGDEQRQMRGALESVDSQLTEHRLKLGEVRVRMDELTTRTAQELSVDLAEQYISYQPQSEDWSAVEVEIEELRAKIERLGNVNLDAILEQDELEQRDGFLVSQRDDLRNGKSQLVELIGKLDADSITRFNETFDSVRSNFGELFRKLFGGGKADIVLSDPAHALECGIDIIARPPGKELQNIALLSGGERTMTTIALLMAIFKTRPSPFTLLDEVDAALDEANNERFNHVIREFLNLTQFIIITHSKRTMGIADVLYGVTMQEPGVSTRVAVRLEDETHAPRSAVA